MKTKLIIGVITVILSYIGIGYFVNDTLSTTSSILSQHQKDKARTDSIISAHTKTFIEQERMIDSLIIGLVTSREDTDGLLERVRLLTRPKVTSEVIEESLSWIEHYNDSLSHLSSSLP